MDATVAEKLRANRARIAEAEARAAAHWLPAVAADAFRWLIDEVGYVEADRSYFGIGTVRLTYRSEKTCVQIAIGLPRDPEFSVEVAPKGHGYVPINDCLAAHHFSKVDLALPYGAGREVVSSKLGAAAAGLRLLIPWEVGGNWYLD